MKIIRQYPKGFFLMRVFIFILSFQIITQILRTDCQSAYLEVLGGEFKLQAYAHGWISGLYVADYDSFTYGPETKYGSQVSCNYGGFAKIFDPLYGTSRIILNMKLSSYFSVGPLFDGGLPGYRYQDAGLYISGSASVREPDVEINGESYRAYATSWIKLETFEPITFLVAADKGQKIGDDAGFLYQLLSGIEIGYMRGGYVEIVRSEIRRNGELLSYERGFGVKIGDIISIEKEILIGASNLSTMRNWAEIEYCKIIQCEFFPTSPAPLPSTVLLLGAGLGLLAIYNRRRPTAKN